MHAPGNRPDRDGLHAPGGLSLGESPWPDVERGGLVLLPIGSTEQHGPHLPFTTDTVIATAVARGLAEIPTLGDQARRDPVGRPSAASPGASSARIRAVVAPALAYGSSGEHQGFAGTMSMGGEALHFVLIELVRSLSTWAGRIVIVNGHGGNVPTLVSAVPQLVAEGHPVGWLPCAVSTEAAELAADVVGPVRDAHAGRFETSLMLHLQPEAVRLPLPPSGTGNTEAMSALLPRLRAGGVAAVSASGILGDPSGASAREGARLLTAMVHEAARCVGGFADASGRLRAPDAPPSSDRPADSGRADA